VLKNQRRREAAPSKAAFYYVCIIFDVASAKRAAVFLKKYLKQIKLFVSKTI
jgi:hypothetical protein